LNLAVARVGSKASTNVSVPEAAKALNILRYCIQLHYSQNHS